MDSIINYLKDHLVMSIIIGSLLAFMFYSFFAVFLNKIHNAKYGKTTVLAWIPGINIFLLGKLAIHWIIGLLLFIGLLFGICISFKIPYLESIKSLMPKEYVLPYQIVYGVIILLVIVIGKIRLEKINLSGKSKANENIFINKKRDEQLINPVNNDHQVVHDNFQYNQSPLSKLNNSTKEQDNKNP